MTTTIYTANQPWNCLQPHELLQFLERHRVSPVLSLESTFAHLPNNLAA